MGSTDQAGDVVKYFLQNPLKVKGKLLEFSLTSSSSAGSMIQVNNALKLYSFALLQTALQKMNFKMNS